MSDWPSVSGGATLPINLTTDVTGTLPLGNGGIGATTLAAADIQTISGAAATYATIASLSSYALLSGTLAQFAATTSLQLKNTISDETGSGSLVFATSPTLVTPILGTPTSGTLTNCTGYVEANITITDVTTNNASTTAHGFLKKLSNSATDFMDGTGAWDTIKDSDLATTDITTNNVSTTKHGFAPKLPNDATKYLDGTGAYTIPTGSGGMQYTDARFELIQATKNLADASTTQAITGCNFTPKAVIVIGALLSTPTFVVAFAENTGSAENDNVATPGDATITFIPSTSFITLYTSAVGGAKQDSVINSWDSDGITIGWTKSGSPTGTANFYLFFLR